MVFETELKKLGLNDKEAAVYLSCLQLGPSPVQPIARKAKVVRATTYVVLEALMEMGLVTKYKEGKKTLFAAEPPHQLGRLVEKEQEKIKEKQRELDNLLPELQVLMKSSEDRPTIRYFAGLEGLNAIRREMVMYSEAGDLWRNFTPVDHLDAVFGQNNIVYKQRSAKKIRSQTLMTTKSERLRDEMLITGNQGLSETRYIPPDRFPSSSGMTIYRDRIAIGNFTGKLGGVVIESDTMADMMIRLFELAWSTGFTADTLDKN